MSDTMKTEKKIELALLMSDISEDCFYAGWISGLEYTLWGMTLDPSKNQFGVHEVPLSEIEKVKLLSREIGEWPVWADDDEPGAEDVDGLWLKWLPLDEWEKTYSVLEAEYARLNAAITGAAAAIGDGKK